MKKILFLYIEFTQASALQREYSIAHCSLLSLRLGLSSSFQLVLAKPCKNSEKVALKFFFPFYNGTMRQYKKYLK